MYRKSGWKETDFVTKTIAARNARPNSPTNLNSTLNRPMASQSGTRYEDRTMQRGGGAAGGGAIAAHMNNSAAAGGFMVSHECRFFSESMMRFSHCPKNIAETILKKRF